MILAAALETSSSAAAGVAAVVTTLMVAAGGVVFLVLVVFIEPDPQGAIAVLLTPLYQAVATAVLLPITRWLYVRNARRAS